MAVTNIKHTDIQIGVEKPFSIIHVSDTHLTLCDGRNDERKNLLACAREKIFPPAEDILCEIEEYSKKNGFTIIHTGDLIDFVSEANLDRAKKFIDDNSVLYVAGNHEYSLYVGEAFEDEAYRNISFDHVQSFFKAPLRFNSAVVGGVNFVGIDNGYYLFDRWQLEELEREVEKGLPIILFMHVPLVDQVIQRADAITLETVEYIKAQPNIKAILSGHAHRDFEPPLTENIPQYVTGITTIRQVNIF